MLQSPRRPSTCADAFSEAQQGLTWSATNFSALEAIPIVSAWVHVPEAQQGLSWSTRKPSALEAKAILSRLSLMEGL